MTFTKCQNIKRRVETMAICPFFEESMWNGNKCKAMIFVIDLIVFKSIYTIKLKIFDWIIDKSV